MTEHKMPISVISSISIWILLTSVGLVGIAADSRSLDGWPAVILLGGHLVNMVVVVLCAARRKWARLVLLFLVVAGIVLMVGNLQAISNEGTWPVLAAIGSNGLALIATLMLFTNGASAWFGRRSRAAPPPAEVAALRRHVGVTAGLCCTIAVLAGAYWLIDPDFTNWPKTRLVCVEGASGEPVADRMEACSRIITAETYTDPEISEIYLARALIRQELADAEQGVAGRNFHLRGSFNDALSAIDADPENLEALLILGNLHLTAADNDLGAAQVFARMLELEPGNPSIRGLLGLALRRLEQFGDAVTHLQAGVEAGTEDPRIHAALVASLYAIDDYEATLAAADAATALPAVTAHEFANREISRTRARSLLSLHRFEDAYDAAVSMQPRDELVSFFAQCAMGEPSPMAAVVQQVGRNNTMVTLSWHGRLVDWEVAGTADLPPPPTSPLDTEYAEAFERVFTAWYQEGCQQPLYDLSP